MYKEKEIVIFNIDGTSSEGGTINKEDAADIQKALVDFMLRHKAYNLNIRATLDPFRYADSLSADIHLDSADKADTPIAAYEVPVNMDDVPYEYDMDDVSRKSSIMNVATYKDWVINEHREHKNHIIDKFCFWAHKKQNPYIVEGAICYNSVNGSLSLRNEALKMLHYKLDNGQ